MRLSRWFVVLAGVLSAAAPATPAEQEWRSLFNGKDLTGWDTWLGVPHGKGKDQLVGLNKDPIGVYSVVDVDGKPAIRISGEVWGAITTTEEFENYHLKLEFKWGEKKWPPREKQKRDSGLLYHCVGPQGAQGSYWMRSQELQIQEGDVGDYYPVAGAGATVEVTRGKGPTAYKKGGEKVVVPSKEIGGRVVKSADGEKKGEWNTVELFVHGRTSVHVVNGRANMVLTESWQTVKGKDEPLTKGKLQLQSEGAEVFYRNIAIRPITKIPDEYLGE